MIEHAKPVAVTEHATSGSINAALAEAPPIKVEPPRLTGTAAVGGTLTCSPGMGKRDAPRIYVASQRHPDLRADLAHLHRQPADGGSRISCRVTAYNRAGGAESATSNLVRIALVATVATTGSTTAAPGTAGLSGSPSLKAGNLTFTLQCTGSGPCSGTVKLLAKVTEKRTVKRHGKRHTVKVTRNITVGETGYSIAIGGTTTLTIHLSAKGRSLLRSAGTKGLKVTLSGAGVQSSTVVLKEKPKHGKKK